MRASLSSAQSDITHKLQNTQLARSVNDNDVRLVTQLLQQGADPDTTDKWGNRVIITAAMNNYVEILNVLMQYNACCKPDELNRTPCFIAVCNGHVHATRLSLNWEDTENHKSALRVAFSQKRIQVIMELLEAGCDPYDIERVYHFIAKSLINDRMKV